MTSLLGDEESITATTNGARCQENDHRLREGCLVGVPSFVEKIDSWFEEVEDVVEQERNIEVNVPLLIYLLISGSGVGSPAVVHE